jgi:hypothetical protein
MPYLESDGSAPDPVLRLLGFEDGALHTSDK